MLTLFAVLDQLMLCEEDEVGDHIYRRSPRHRAEPADTPAHNEDFDEDAEPRRVSWLERWRALLSR